METFGEVVKMKRKYVVFGGEVISKNDGEIHYIPAYKVCELYGLNPHASNVILVDIRRPETYKWLSLMKLEDGSWTFLYPRSDGNYTLPEGGKNEKNGL